MSEIIHKGDTFTMLAAPDSRWWVFDVKQSRQGPRYVLRAFAEPPGKPALMELSESDLLSQFALETQNDMPRAIAAAKRRMQA